METLQETMLMGMDPHSTYGDLVCPGVALSILLHSIMYVLALMLIMCLVLRRRCDWLTPSQLVAILIVLIVIMTAGYPLRLWRARALYEATGRDAARTREIMTTAYACWYFLG